MKKSIILIIFACCLLLSGCSAQSFESGDYHFKVRFPKELTVFVPGQTKADDPALKEYGLDTDTLTAFKEQQGGVFYAVGKQDEVYREVLVNVQETDYSKSLWQLQSTDIAAIDELLDEMIETFNTGGVEALQKGQFAQGKAYCVFLNLNSGQNTAGQIDSIYMCTIYNGLQYAVLYQANAPLTDDMQKEAQAIFDSFFITQTLANPNEEPKDTTTIRAVLIVIILLIFITVIVLITRSIHSQRKKTNEQQQYTPQFKDTLSSTSRKKDRKS